MRLLTISQHNLLHNRKIHNEKHPTPKLKKCKVVVLKGKSGNVHPIKTLLVKKD